MYKREEASPGYTFSDLPARTDFSRVANVGGKMYLCDADYLKDNNLQDMFKEFAVSAVVHGAVFVLFMLVGNWIFH